MPGRVWILKEREAGLAHLYAYIQVLLPSTERSTMLLPRVGTAEKIMGGSGRRIQA